MTDSQYLMDRMAVDTASGCWVWTLVPDRHGYGVAYLRGARIAAHRLSYSLFVGPLVEGLVIDHLCRTRACVNPEHLEQVTNEENVSRGIGAWAGTFSSPPVVEVEGAPEGHGTIAGYQNRRCRCNYCREANRLYMRARRVRLGLARQPARGGYAKIRGGAA